MNNELRDSLDSIRKASFREHERELVGWIRRTEEQLKPRRWLAGRGTGTVRFPVRYRLAAGLTALLLLAAFVPVTQDETLGHLLLWISDGGPAQGQATAERLGFPASHVVLAPEPNQPRTRFVLLLPNASDVDAGAWLAQLRMDDRVDSVAHVVVNEKIDRTAYDAFFAHLPASLSRRFGVYSRAFVDLNRFRTLAAPHVNAWLGNDHARYNLSAGMRRDSLAFSVVPWSKHPLATERERLFGRYFAAANAIDLLAGDHHSQALHARTLLEAYRDSLAAVIAGNSESKER